jgi:uncharacterized protein (TIGR04255 family)
MRYVNRLVGEEFLANLSNWVRPEVLGAHAFVPSEFADLMQSQCESRFSVGGRGAQTRWATLPANAITDPAIDPVGEMSWILDFDMFTLGPQSFDTESVAGLAREFSEYAYSFFRWAVKPELLTRFGGDPS